ADRSAPPAWTHRRPLWLGGAAGHRAARRLGTVYLAAGGAGALVGAWYRVRIPRGYPGISRRRAGAPNHWSVPGPVLQGDGGQPSRRGLSHRAPARGGPARRGADPAADVRCP